jgi:hypothetical protein
VLFFAPTSNQCEIPFNREIPFNLEIPFNRKIPFNRRTATDAADLELAGIGGAKHCIFHVRIEGRSGAFDTVDFAVASPEAVRSWVDGLSQLLHIGSVGIGLQVRQFGGKFVVVGAVKGGPAERSRMFLQSDTIGEIDSFRLTSRTTFDQFEALMLGVSNSDVTVGISRNGQQVQMAFSPRDHLVTLLQLLLKLRRGPLPPPE